LIKNIISLAGFNTIH